MYVGLSELKCLLIIVAVIALVVLTLTLIKLFKVISKVNSIVDKNEENINSLLSSLPKTSDNLLEITDNFKTVSEVVTETTATIIEKKESAMNYLTLIKDVFDIIKTCFSKK